jgi:molybdopterin molybdotransferase
MGDLDLVKGLLEELAQVHFRRLRMKPGKPVHFATAGDTLLFGLPGNPVSVLVGFEVFMRPALRAMQGATDIDRPRVPVRFDDTVRPGDRIEYQRAVVRVEPDGMLAATSTGPQASSRLLSAVGANALVIVPPASEPIPAGTRLNAILIGPLAGDAA